MIYIRIKLVDIIYNQKIILKIKMIVLLNRTNRVEIILILFKMNL
jgi:hypothetical protein